MNKNRASLMQPSKMKSKKAKKKRTSKDKTNIQKSSEKITKSQGPPEKDRKMIKGYKVMELSEIPPDDSDISDAFETDEELMEENDSKVMEDTEPKYVEGYKVMKPSDIPSDDSDVSDAFETDEEFMEDNNSSATNNVKPKFVEGYKVVKASDLLADDSDISDAFEMDDDDSQDAQMVKETEKSEDDPECHIKNKAILKMIKTFGVDMNALMKSEKKEPINKNIVDISQKRGQKRKREDDKKQKDTPKQEKKSAKQQLLEQQKLMREDTWKVIKLAKPVNKMSTEEYLDKVYELGGHKRKSKGINYKNLIEQRTEEKRIQKEQKIIDAKLNLTKKKKGARKTPSRDPKRDRGVDPQIGKFKNGVLKLSKKDLFNLRKK